MEALWQRYLCRGRFWTRVFRAAPMTGLYILAFVVAFIAMRPLIGDFPRPPIRNDFPYFYLMTLTIIVFLFLTFFVIDAILLHKGFLIQLEEKETYWPDATFEKFEYPIDCARPKNESDLADYWDILLISKRTEAQSTGPSVARRLFHNRRDIGQAATASLVTRFDRAMYSCWRSRTAPVSAGSWNRMLFS